MVPLGVIGDQVAVPPEVALQTVHGPRQRRELGIATREVPHAPLDLPEPLKSTRELAVPQVPFRVLERLLQFSGAFRVQATQALETLAHTRQPHRQVEPIEQVARVGAQVALELARAVLAVREEHQLLVVLQALAPEHLRQVSSRPGIMALHEAEALDGTVPWDRFAHDR